MENSVIIINAKTQFRHNEYRLLGTIFFFFSFLFFKIFWRTHVPFYGTTDTPILDFWWRLPWVSKPGWTCLYAFLPARYSSDSPLVRHLPTSWQQAWQQSPLWPNILAAIRHIHKHWWRQGQSRGSKPIAWAGVQTHDLPCHSIAHLPTLPSFLSL